MLVSRDGVCEEAKNLEEGCMGKTVLKKWWKSRTQKSEKVFMVRMTNGQK